MNPSACPEGIKRAGLNIERGSIFLPLRIVRQVDFSKYLHRSWIMSVSLGFCSENCETKYLERYIIVPVLHYGVCLYEYSQSS